MAASVPGASFSMAAHVTSTRSTTCRSLMGAAALGLGEAGSWPIAAPQPATITGSASSAPTAAIAIIVQP